MSDESERKLKYGENPHQSATVKIDLSYEGPTVLNKPLLGPEMSTTSVYDSGAALDAMIDLRNSSAAVVIKHTNPCGLATGGSLEEAFQNAWFGDEISAFGSFVGFSQKLTFEAAKKLGGGKHVVGVIAPDYEDKAVDWLKRRKKGTAVIKTGELVDTSYIETRSVRGGEVSQTSDNRLYLAENIDDLLDECQKLVEPNSGITYARVGPVTEEKFAGGMEGLVEFSIIAGKHTKSNAIILAYEYEAGKYRVLGMGAGQPNRMDSGAKLSLPKATENLMRQYFRENSLNYPWEFTRMLADPEVDRRIRTQIFEYTREIIGSKKVVLFSDAFFPFRDGLVAAAELGVKYIVSPGGSKGDEDVIKAANEMGVAMVFTGIRHFKH